MSFGYLVICKLKLRVIYSNVSGEYNLKLSLFTVAFAGLWGQHRLSLDQSIDKAADLGFEGVELMGKRPHFSPLDYSMDQCKVLRDRVESRSLSVAALAAYTNFTGGGESPEVPFADLQIGYVEQLAQRAPLLGCDLIRIFSAYECDGQSFATQWFKTVDCIRECCDRAAQHGVTIGLQNHHDIGVSTKSYAELLEQIDRPNIVPMYDCWSIHLMGEDIVAGVRQMAEKMHFTTVADYITLPRAKYCPQQVNYVQDYPPGVIAVPMGEGELDYPTFFNTLAAAGFNGWVSFEICSPVRDGGKLETLEQYCSTFVDYMKRWKYGS